MKTDLPVEDMIIDSSEFLFVLDSRHEEDFSMNFHRHNFYELSFVIAGEGYCQNLCEGSLQKNDIRKNCVILRDGRIPHRAVDRTGTPLQQLIIIFDEAYLGKLKDRDVISDTLKNCNPLILSNTLHTAPLKPLFREILTEIKDRKTGRDSMVFSIFSRIMVKILRAGQDSGSPGAGDVRISRVLDYMHSHYYLNLSIQSAAEISALSLRQFSDVFKKETGKTFTQYLNYIRIEKTKEALIDTDSSITEIAFSAGYDDLSYFTRRFKTQESMSPRSFRKQYGK